ncbi:MAG: PAC2 family protein [Candidatus Omnitrophota bacterium]|nr:PAC2 family protein [Candidatus Omnitrophota bacterium]
MEGIKIFRKPRLKEPYLIVAWPGMGEVAIKAANYLIDKLKAEQFAEILPSNFFYLTESVVKNGILRLPEPASNKLYFWKNRVGGHDLIILVSDSQPDLIKAEEYSRQILSLAKLLKVKRVVSFAAMPQAIDHTQDAGVWFAATNQELGNLLKRFNLQQLNEGQVSGMNGLFLGLAKREGLEGFCLLGEVPLYTIQIENPKASYSVLEALNKVVRLNIDFSELIDQVHAVETQINSLLDYLKLGPSAQGPIQQDEIEKIKKSLSQLTKLPLSIKEKIEKLFGQAKSDISKANDLKSELDKWNVYKEYEDRFLDLFKNNKEKSS